LHVDVSAIILAVAVLAIAAALLLITLSPPTPTPAIPLPTSALPVTAALALPLARPAPPLATRSPGGVRALATRRVLTFVRIVSGLGTCRPVRGVRFAGVLASGLGLSCPRTICRGRAVLFLIARVVLLPPIVG